MTWEWTLARPLLILHAITGFAATALAVHLGLVAWQAARRSSPRRRRLAATYSRTLLVCLSVCVLSGALAYPAFRVGVRAAWMDAQQPALTGLFEIKEHWGSLCLALTLALAVFFRGRARRPVDHDPSWSWAVLLTAMLTTGLLYDLVAGLFLVLVGSP